MAPIHTRMPAILSPEQQAAWLNPETPLDALPAVLRPAPEDLLAANAISKLVNSPKNDVSAVIEPVSDS
jgi:putative SOS response-associated peptidase YedK